MPMPIRIHSGDWLLPPINLSLSDCLSPLSTQALPARPESLCIVEMGQQDDSGTNSSTLVCGIGGDMLLVCGISGDMLLVYGISRDMLLVYGINGIYYLGIAIHIAIVGLVGICCKFVGLECAMGV